VITSINGEPATSNIQLQELTKKAGDTVDLDHLRNAAAVLGSKATTKELDEYRRFVLTLAGKVAAVHREHGQDVSPAEAEAIQQITEALGSS